MKWMHGNGCESVLRNPPFESGLHGSPDLFCDSRVEASG